VAFTWIMLDLTLTNGVQFEKLPSY